MRTKLVFIFSFIATISILSSCFKNEEYPNEPIISNPQVFFSGDSLKLTFDFTDGDGDIGLDPDELDSPYDADSYFYYNLYLDYFEKDDELGWVRGLDFLGDSISFKYRIKPIIVKGKARGIKGTTEVYINEFYNKLSDDSDTIKYEISFIDKALNISNIIETNEILP